MILILVLVLVLALRAHILRKTRLQLTGLVRLMLLVGECGRLIVLDGAGVIVGRYRFQLGASSGSLLRLHLIQYFLQSSDGVQDATRCFVRRPGWLRLLRTVSVLALLFDTISRIFNRILASRPIPLLRGLHLLQFLDVFGLIINIKCADVYSHAHLTGQVILVVGCFCVLSLHIHYLVVIHALLLRVRCAKRTAVSVEDLNLLIQAILQML